MSARQSTTEAEAPEVEVQEFDAQEWVKDGVKAGASGVKAGVKAGASGVKSGVDGVTRRVKSPPRPPQIFPDEFTMHWRAARREMLLAVRSLVDAGLDKLEPETEEAAAAES